MSNIRIPAELAWLTGVVGEDAVLLLIEAHGGTRIYVAKTMPPEHPLALAIGAAAAARLATAFGGETIKVPTCKHWRARVYSSRGLSYAAVARKLGATETSVWRWLNAGGDTQQQLALPL